MVAVVAASRPVVVIRPAAATTAVAITGAIETAAIVVAVAR
jgi:hypothetical protein